MNDPVFSVNASFDAPVMIGIRGADDSPFDSKVCDWKFVAHKKKKTSKPTDFLAGNKIMLVSGTVSEVLANWKPGGIELCEVCVEGLDDTYFILNVNRTIDCLDLQKSEILYASDDPNKILMIDRAFFRGERAQATLLFKVPQIPSRIYCTMAFVDLVLKQSWTGVYFEHPHEEQFGQVKPLFGTPLGMVLRPSAFTKAEPKTSYLDY